MQIKPWLTAYLLVALLEIGAEVSATEWLVWCTKPLLMPLLFVWLYQESNGRQRFLSQSIRAGLLFAWLGDILLMFSGSRFGQLFFLLGLGAFLGTHLCYMGGFFRETNLRNGLLRKHPLLVAPFAMFLAVFLNWLWPGIPDGMKLPVAAYGIAISVMALSVVNGRNRYPGPVFTQLLAGSLLFMFSDCLIAANKFGHPFPGARVAIMTTYITGQLLLAHGVIRILHLSSMKMERV